MDVTMDIGLGCLLHQVEAKSRRLLIPISPVTSGVGPSPALSTPEGVEFAFQIDPLRAKRSALSQTKFLI